MSRLMWLVTAIAACQSIGFERTFARCSSAFRFAAAVMVRPVCFHLSFLSTRKCSCARSMMRWDVSSGRKVMLITDRCRGPRGGMMTTPLVCERLLAECV